MTMKRTGMALGLATCAASVLVPAGAPAAHAASTPAWTAGPCSQNSAQAKTGTTIVVDFQQLNGNGGTPASTIVRCSPGVAGVARTGVQALQDAGLNPEGVQQWGLGFICRIAGRPSATETLPITGDTGYKEACVRTPKAAAYWSYRYGGAGQTTWTYSEAGASNRTVVQGGFEGWSFSLNATATTNPPPRVTPATASTVPTVSVVGSDLDQTISLGSSVTMTWKTANLKAASCTVSAPANAGWSGNLAGTSGTPVVQPGSKGTFTYTVSCTPSTGTAPVVATTKLTVN